MSVSQEESPPFQGGEDVNKVKRRYVDLKKAGDSRTHSYDPERGARESEMRAGTGLNAGHLFFETEEHIERWRHAEMMRKKIEQFFRPTNEKAQKPLTEEDLETIFAITSRIEGDQSQ